MSGAALVVTQPIAQLVLEAECTSTLVVQQQVATLIAVSEQGPAGTNGTNGQDGVAEIPDILDGGHF